MTNQARDSSIAGKVAARVRRGGERAWTVADFPELPARAVNAALRRLAKNDELKSVRHGIYWRGRRRPWGMSLPDPLQLAAAVVKVHGIGWAGLSASNILGTTTQVPAIETVAIPAPPPREIPGVRIMNRAAKGLRAVERLTPLEVAVLEVLGDWAAVIDVTPSEAVGILARHIRDGNVRAAKITAASAEELGPTRDRLRAVLTSAGEDTLASTIPTSSTPSVTARALAGVA